jgi:hypothetical protein
MTEADLKLLFLNSFTLGVSMATVEITLKIALLAVSIGYTVQRWYYLHKNKDV